MRAQTDTILTQWLAQQCRMIPGAVQAVLLTATADEGAFDTALYYWPDQISEHSQLAPLAQAAAENRKSVLKPRNSTRQQTDEPLDGIACPLYADGRMIGVVAMEIMHRAELMQRAAVQQIQAGAQWLEILLRLGGEEAREQLLNLVDLMAAALEQERFQIAATELATLLAQRLSCSQVSLGFLHHNKVRVTALSNTQQLDPHTSLVTAIRDAMGEALDQGARILWPLPEVINALQATHFHTRLSEMRQGVPLCTIPLVKNGKAIGAMLLERPAEAPFDLDTVDQSEQIALLLAPVLETKRREERSLLAQVAEKAHHLGQRLFGRGHWQLKFAAIACVVLVALLYLADGTQRVVSDSVLEAKSSQVIAAPQQGYIAEARVRAGDRVQKGDLLVTLDNKALLMEQRKWQSQRAQLLKESQKALAGYDRAEVAILSAR
nr:biotin/lipoyl-binding protein [uncultured Desulfobulbus sp.]